VAILTGDVVVAGVEAVGKIYRLQGQVGRGEEGEAERAHNGKQDRSPRQQFRSSAQLLPRPLAHLEFDAEASTRIRGFQPRAGLTVNQFYQRENADFTEIKKSSSSSRT
jgi:hypothetical protein